MTMYERARGSLRDESGGTSTIRIPMLPESAVGCEGAASAPEAYRGEFYPGPHKFDLTMQEAAFGWLVRQLAP